ncbi:MAG TPA: PrsW family glutamic-type intramembrane protease [Verrucomicrobiae bacterium]|nr:PrsW family glutamic-type intramembrane protease [Verrucomicrobiae bacterium]
MNGSEISGSIILVCVGGPDLGKRLAITPQSSTIGRSASCEVASDDPDSAERHVTISLRDNQPVFKTEEGAVAFLDGQRRSEGTLQTGQQLRIGRSLWQIANPAAANNVSSFFGSLSERISEAAGVEKLEGFDPATMFSEVFRKRTDEELEHYFAAGTPLTTPPLSQVETTWPKPWLFVKIFVLAALVYLGFVFALNQFQNPILIPGLLTIGAFVIPFSLLIFFFEINVVRNVPLYQIGKLLFLGGILSVILSLFLFRWTHLHDWLGAMSAGIIEEAGKGAALFLVINKLKYRWTLNGMLFGAAVGAGFASFESAGYAFLDGAYGSDAMLHSITQRGILSIFGGHVLWTALVGGALWRVRGAKKFHWEMLKDVRFLRVYALCAAMHMIWNSPLQLPFLLKYIALGFVAWVALLSFIQSGLRQIRAAQSTGATEFFKRESLLA